MMSFTQRAPDLLSCLIVAVALLTGCADGSSQSAAAADEAAAGIAPEKVAALVHTVIQADRTVYAERVVQRLQNIEEVITADEHFDELKTLPLPAQMLRMGAELASESGEIRYALVSPWAINKANLPKNDVEKQGVEAVIANPEQPFHSYQTVRGQKYFVAVYPDRAVSQACVTCHNEHPETTRTDFQLDDVMGAVVINLPLE